MFLLPAPLVLFLAQLSFSLQMNRQIFCVTAAVTTKLQSIYPSVVAGITSLILTFWPGILHYSSMMRRIESMKPESSFTKKNPVIATLAAAAGCSEGDDLLQQPGLPHRNPARAWGQHEWLEQRGYHRLLYQRSRERKEWISVGQSGIQVQAVGSCWCPPKSRSHPELTI